MSASIEEIQAEMEVAKTTIATERAEVQSALAAQAAKIEALTAQIGSVVVPGSVATQEQLDALFATTKEVTGAVADIFTPAA